MKFTEYFSYFYCFSYNIFTGTEIIFAKKYIQAKKKAKNYTFKINKRLNKEMSKIKN